MLNTAEHGVPQARERVFMVESRDGRTFRFPESSIGDPAATDPDLFGTLQPVRTAWDAIGDLAEPHVEEPGLKVGGKWGELLPTIPEGDNYLWHTARGGGAELFGWRTRYWSFPPQALEAVAVLDRPGAARRGDRSLPLEQSLADLAELCRIQTFPEGLNVESGRTEMQRMLGNAVPSLMAELLTREVRRQLLDTPLNSELQLLRRCASRCPPPHAWPSCPPSTGS